MLVSCNEVHSVVVVMPGSAISSVLSQGVVFLGTAIWLFGSLVIVVACYRAMQRVTIILKRLELYLNHNSAFQILRFTVLVSEIELWKLGDILLLFTTAHRLCFKINHKREEMFGSS